jgi:hypothetical protein
MRAANLARKPDLFAELRQTSRTQGQPRLHNLQRTLAAEFQIFR